jgi:hypothetical protein
MTHRMMSLIVLGVPLVLGAPAIAQTVTGSGAGEGDLGVATTVAPTSTALGVDGSGSLASNVGTNGASTSNFGVNAGGNLIATAMVGGNAALNGTTAGNVSVNAGGAAQGAGGGTASGNTSVNGKSCASADAAFGLSTADLTANAGDCTP